ncbi:MAG: TrkH family potassium uptake protein [Bacteroidetes bacterium]|nr:TrkH family potassium uptake protein [Bacteroidota bacterium]
MRFNFKVIFNILGLLLMLNGLFMLLCLPVSYYFIDHNWTSLISSGSISIFTGFITWYLTRKSESKELRKRDGYLIVTLGWITMSLFGTLPYLISGSIPLFTDAFFETISGFTTTGATILNEIEQMPPSILFWRSLTQWIGGMGIIVLAVAILPFLGIGGMQLFVAEAPGFSPDKLQPRIRETAKRLWLIYVGLTALEIVLLKLGGMSYFDAFNHGLTTMATGGFSTKQESIAYFSSPFIQYIIIVFMFLGGTNFTLIYFGLKGRFRSIWRNEEYRTYTWGIIITALIVTVVVFGGSGEDFEESFRYSLFQVVAIITTTGYVTADYTSWAPFATVLFLVLMFFGASAGSTSGGVKIVRHLILLKNSFLELKRQLHPSGIIPVRLNGKAIPPDINFNILAFIMIYITIFATGSILMAMMGVEFETAIGAVAATLGNVGPGIGAVGPASNYADIPLIGKWLLAFFMLVGRLELFTVLILFTPHYWQK